MNSSYLRGILTGVVVVGAILVVVAFQGTPKFGNIDLDRVVRESKTGKAAEATFKAETTLRNDLLQFFDSNRLLDDNQRKEIKDLWLTDKRTPAQEQRLTLLKDQGAILQKELATLQSTTNLTADQKSRLELLTTRYREAERGFLPRLQDEFQGDLEKKRQDSLTAIVKRVKALVQQAGAAQGCSAVFDSQYAPFAQIDLSESVMKELDK